MNIVNTNDLEQLVEHLKNRAIWLDPIEMYPDSGHPLVGLLVRIEHAMGQFGFQDNCVRDNCTGQWFSQIDNDMWHNFRLAMCNAAIAMPGNLPQRAEHLDPDAYAVELMRAEHGRLSFKQQFEHGMKGLVSYLHKRGICREPIFCLPLLDYEIHFASHMKIIEAIQHWLVDPIEVFVVADCEVPMNIRRNVDRFHIMDTRQYGEMRRRVDEGSWHLQQAARYERRW